MMNRRMASKERLHRKRKQFTAAILLVLSIVIPFGKGHSQEDSPANEMRQSNDALAESQQKIDQLSNRTRQLLKEYLAIQQKNDYQQFYQFQLKQLNSEQVQRIQQLEQQLEELNYIELAMLPMMQSMLAALEQFILLDLPFKQNSRITNIKALEQELASASLTLPEKYRMLLEAWQIENDYGRTIETWRDELQAEQQILSVEFLRIGRIALYYRTMDGSQVAMWDKQNSQWLQVAQQTHRDLSRAFDVAAERLAPELLQLPFSTGGSK